MSPALTQISHVVSMATWVKAVNEQGGYGQWCFDVVFEPAKIRDVVIRYFE